MDWTATATQLVARTTTLSRAQGRDDFVDRLGHSRRRLADPSVRVLVVGEFKQGKSMLVNALVNAPVCPVDDDIATAVPTEVAYGEQPRAFVLLRSNDDPPRSGWESTTHFATTLKREVPMGELGRYTSGSIVLEPDHHIVGAQAFIPREMLRTGLVLVDTPGMGGLSSMHTAATTGVLPTADAVLLVSDAGSEFSAPEMTLLRQVLSACPTVLCVQSKTDLHADWRSVVDVNRAHLERADLHVDITPVSAQLRLRAAATRDVELNTESNVTELVANLHRRVIGRRDALLLASTRHDLLTVIDGLAMTVSAHKGALEDPASLPELTEQLSVAQQRANELKQRSARWQVTLNDGMSDLSADLDHDLRDRVRRVMREAEASIEAGDPGKVWDEFSQWLEGRITEALTETFHWADENATWLVESVGKHFDEDSKAATPVFQLRETTGLIDPVAQMGKLDPGILNSAQKVIIGLRGSYGGVLMFGVVTGLAGMALINPISVGAGLLMGTKVYRDELQNRLKRRRAEANALVRKYVDDVIFQVNKELREQLRIVQRTVREYYTGVAEQHSRSIAASLEAAKQAAITTTAQRSDALKETTSLAAELAGLRRQVESLGMPRGPAAVKPPPTPVGSARGRS